MLEDYLQLLHGTSTQNEIQEVKSVLIENIDKVLERGERIELLVDRTEVLDQHAFKFKKKATKLKRAMWWKNAKMVLAIGFIILALIYIVAAIAWYHLPSQHR